MSQLMFSFLGHYFIFKKNASFSLLTSSTLHKKGATWRILGAPTILAMAEDKLALNPPKYLDFGIIHVLVQVAFAHVAKLGSTSAIRWSWCRSLSSGFAQNQTCTFHLEDWLCYFRSYFHLIRQVCVCDVGQSILTAGPLGVPVVVNSLVSCPIAFHLRLIYQMNRYCC